MDVLYAKLDKRAEAATGSYSVKGNSLQYIYSVPVSKNHQNIQSRCLVYEFSFTSYIKEKFFVAASILYGCGYLFL